MKARLAAWIVLVLASGASLALMWTVGGAFQPVWFWSTLGGLVVALGVAWWATGALAGKRRDADRFKMPVRPELEAAMKMPRREFEPSRTVSTPRRDQFVSPSSLASASLPEVSAQVEEIEEEPETTEPPSPPEPDRFVFRGFTLYERTRKGQITRFFSKKKPVGGGQPTLLPDGFDVRWDSKHRKPILVPPKAPTPETLVPEPAAETMVAVAPRTIEPILVEEPTAKPCSAMTSPGIFCDNPARSGEIYCARHMSARAPAEPKIEVTRDGVARGGKAPKFALPDFQVNLDRASRKPVKALRPRKVEVQVRADKSTPAKPGKARKTEFVLREDKAHTLPEFEARETELNVRADRPEKEWTRPVRPRTVEVDIRAAQTHEFPKTKTREGRVEIRAAQAHEMPRTRTREGRVEIRAAKAHEMPQTRPKEGRVVIREAEAHELPAIRPKELKMDVRRDRATSKPSRKTKGRVVTVEIHEDKAHFKPFKLKSTYDPMNARIVAARGTPIKAAAGKRKAVKR